MDWLDLFFCNEFVGLFHRIAIHPEGERFQGVHVKGLACDGHASGQERNNDSLLSMALCALCLENFKIGLHLGRELGGIKAKSVSPAGNFQRSRG